MDSLDAALLRAMLRDGVYGFTGIDPRRSVSKLATRVGVSRNSVRDRLHGWKTSGFHSGTAVFANPDLFERQFVGQYLKLRDPKRLPELASALTSDPRLFLAYEFESPFGKELMVSTLYLVAHRREADAARVLDCERLSVEPGGPPFLVDFPSSKFVPGPLDWKIMRCFRREPERSCRAVARDLGIQERRVRRHLNAMLDGDALFFVPLYVMAHARGSVLLAAAIVKAEQKPRIGAEIEARYPDLVKLVPDSQLEELIPDAPDGTKLSTIAFLLPVRIGQLAPEALRALGEIKGVYQVTTSYPIRNHENRRCFDRLLESRGADRAKRSPEPATC